MGLAANVRRAGFTFFGVFGTERNTQWLQQVEEAIPKGVCTNGPALSTPPNTHIHTPLMALCLPPF